MMGSVEDDVIQVAANKRFDGFAMQETGRFSAFIMVWAVMVIWLPGMMAKIVSAAFTAIDE